MKRVVFLPRRRHATAAAAALVTGALPTLARRSLSSSSNPPNPSSSLPQSLNALETNPLPATTGNVDASVPWKWLPPPARAAQSLEDEAKGQRNPSVARPKLTTHIPVIPKVHLTKEEIMQSFILHGASNVLWKPCGSLADAMVFATARSNAHAKMLAEVVVRATRERKLYTFNKFLPIEGKDDWFLVDTGVLMVNCFSGEKKRREVDLEGHLDELAKHSKALKEKWGEDADPAFLQAELEKLMKVDDESVPDGTECVPGFKDDGSEEVVGLAQVEEVEEAGGFEQVLEEMDKRAKLRKRQQKKRQQQARDGGEASTTKKDMAYYTGLSEAQLAEGQNLQEVGETKDEDESMRGITNVIRGRRRQHHQQLEGKKKTSSIKEEED